MTQSSNGKLVGKRLFDGILDSAAQWNLFWFKPTDVATLAVVRILTGLVLFYVHVTMLPFCLDAFGPDGWVDAEAWKELSAAADPFRWSLWSLEPNSQFVVVTYISFLAAIVCMTLGFGSRWAAVAVWLGHLSFSQRGFAMCYGLDSIAAFLTLYLMIGPCGGAFSVDAVLARRRNAGRRTTTSVADFSISANVAVRCIQIHMCLVYLFAGLAKLQGSQWWSGIATYYAAMTPEMWPIEFDLQWIGRHPQLVQVLANLSVLFTLAYEINFVWLIWNPRLRPLLLLSAAVLHLGIGFSMGLGAFGLIMLAGCSAFVEPKSWRSFARFLVNRFGENSAHPSCQSSQCSHKFVAR